MTEIAVATEAELVDAIASARADRHTLEILGAGTKRGFGRPLATTDVLDVSGLTGIVKYEPEELVLTVQAGTPVTEIERELAPRHQRLGFDPADWGPLFGAPAASATIVGALSADTSGSARLRYGAARDHLLGYRAVNGFAEAYKGGGRVVKNVTGFDLPKLMCGALGTLGVLSEVTLKLVPRAPLTATLVVRDVTAQQGLDLIRRVWASPLEATGLAFVPACIAEGFGELGAIGTGAILLRVEGADLPLTEKLMALRGMLERLDARQLPEGDALFAKIASGGAFMDRAVDIWRLMVPPGASVATAHALAGTQWVADWAGGLFWVGLSRTDAAMAAKLRQIASRANGQAVLLRASAAARADLPVFPPEDQARAGLTRSVKSAFDPLGLFNPGRMFEGV